MKVESVETFVVGTPPPHNGGAFWIFVKLTTDGGVSGIGEVYAPPFSPYLATEIVDDVADRYLIGEDPFQIERLWRLVYSSGFTQRPDVTLSAILSGLETACWDIVGKELNRPIYDLMGGKVRERIRSYTYIYPQPGSADDVYGDARAAAERAVTYMDQGFDALKFDPVGAYSAFDPRQLRAAELEHAESFVETIREAVGGKVDLLIGTHGQMTASSAIRLAKRLERFDPMWLEEPIPPDNASEMAHVASSTTIPIATGERLATKYEFARILECRAASVLQMAIGRVGGILETKKIASAAEASHVDIAPHLYAGPIECAANLQVATCTPNFLIQESIETMGGFHSELLHQPIRWEDGFLIAPSGPGLGVELNEAVAREHAYGARGLHLEMADYPVDRRSSPLGEDYEK